MRDRSIDVSRGLLVLMMVYGHVLQFFGDAQLFPAVNRLIDVINLTVFPTFVFCFGATTALAYLSKPYRRALPGMLRTGLRAYGVFVLSGVGYRVLRENKAFAVGTVRRVLQLSDIPGWSEFLIAFALYSLLTIVLFALLRRLMDRPLLALAIGALCLACTELVPYDSVAPTQLALFIGGTDFSYFPVVQYMPYFLAGMVYTRLQKRWRLLVLAAVCSAAAGVKTALTGGLPSRFPPDWAWILLPALLTALVLLIAKGLCALDGSRIGRASRVLSGALSHFGSRSLYYLLTSNLVLFTLSGKGIVPSIARKSILPWTAPIQSPGGALCWTAVLLLALWFVAGLAGRGAQRHRDAH